MKITVGAAAFDDLTLEEATASIVQMAQKTDRPRTVCTANLDHLVLLSHDAEFRAAYADADLVLADGAPVVWLSRLAAEPPGTALPERVAGSDLFWELARASATARLRLFFLGGRPGAAEAAAEKVRRRHPGALVCGTYCPPVERFETEEEQSKISRLIQEARPDVLLVGLGAPKQEKWIAARKDGLGVPVLIGVGGSFEMASGVVRRAPLALRRAGMEWVYRLAQEPGRLWRRYLLRDLPFLLTLFAQAIDQRRQQRREAVAKASGQA